MKTVLAIGDEKDFDSFRKFTKQQKIFKKNNLIFKAVSYASLLKGNLPEIETEDIIAFFFFPFEYWDHNIEIKKSNEMYGNKTYFLKFRRFWKKIDKLLRIFYKNKKIHFINSPDKIYLGRDKLITKQFLLRAGIAVPRSYSTKDPWKILNLLAKNHKIFIKVRCGSMGKGISYFEKDRWLTNFRFKNKMIISRKSDYGWTFTDITGNHKFLKELLMQDILIEEAIEPLLLDGRIFDLRVYVAFGNVMYVYPRSNESGLITTNISQGARGESPHFTHRIPKVMLDDAMANSIKAAKAMNLNFAGIDILLNRLNGEVIVLEVNSFPGFPKTRRFNLSRHLIEAISKQKWC